MSNTCCAANLLAIRVTPLALALAAMLSVSPLADAASIGHSRLLSAAGQPLSINVPIRQLSNADLQSLRVGAAPAAAWQQAGLVPPVELSSLRFTIEPGFSDDARVVQVRSNQPFNGPVADLLLQVDTAAGSRQHQVSLLAQAAHPGASSQLGGGSVGTASSAGVALGSAPAQRSISVRRGDTLFALARANAVEGVSVYQMMIALQKANPQAFIEGNINLVKAGATLAIPDTAALLAVSDREARRIFQQHAQAFAAYREGIAARRSAPVQGGSAQQGTVSSSAGSALVEPAAAAGDQVVLSSGQASDAARDQKDATQQNIDESKGRISQLERNVQSLNQALQMQGEAAKDAVLEGAATVGQTLSEAADSITSSDNPVSSSASASAGASSAAAIGRTTVPDTNNAAKGVSVQSDQVGGPSTQAAAPNGASASATSNGVDTAGTSDATRSGVTAQQGTVGETNPGQVESGQTDSTSSSSKAEQPVSWLQENLLGVITGILALFVLIIAWLLRRASASRSEDSQGGVTEAMVQERLEKIDLDFDTPPTDQRPSSRAS